MVEQIDSLDTEKQTKKRDGKDISDLEAIQAKLVDSLQALRSNFQNETQAPLPQKEHTPGILSINSFIHPTTKFDWIIIIVSTIALFSAMVLFIGIINLFRNRIRKPKRSKRPTIQQKAQATAYQKAKAAPSRDTELIPEQNLTIDRLRQRIHDDTITHVQPAEELPLQVLNSKPTDEEKPYSSNLEAKIMKAYQNGLDINDISRKYHLSADHVSLILKITGKQIKNNPQ